MSDIDYSKIAEFNRQRKIRSIAGYQYLEYADFIYACRMLNWRHTEILDYLYSYVAELKEISLANRIDNNRLVKLLSYWKGKGLINMKNVSIAKEKIENELYKNRQNDVNETSEEYQEKNYIDFTNRANYSLLTFLKEVEKQIELNEIDKKEARDFYDNFSKQYQENVSSLVAEFLYQRDNRASN
jgi:hypothetical protein